MSEKKKKKEGQMTAWQKLFLAFATIVTFALSWSLWNNPRALRNYQLFKEKAAQLQMKVQREQAINEHLKRRIMAMQYDHRIIEQAIRDHLSFVRKGESVVILPR